MTILRSRRAVFLLVISYLGFVSLGLPDGLLGVAWPSIRRTFGLPVDALGALLVATTAGYVSSSFASGRILARTSVGTLLAASCATMAASLLGYALTPHWSSMIALAVLAGLGAGAIDAGINTHVATHHSARTLNLLHAFYGLGTTAGPLLMTAVLAADRPWRHGYALVAVAQLVLAGGFALTRHVWPAAPASGASGVARASAAATLRLSAARYGVLAFLLYAGVEAGAGAWAYTLLHEGRGVAMDDAGYAVSTFWGGLTVGRVGFSFLPDRVGAHAVLRGSIATVLVAAALLALDGGYALDLFSLAVLGCASGPIFPTLIATTARRVGELHAPNAIGFQIAGAAAGQAFVPSVIGLIADAHGLGSIPPSLAVAAGILLIVYLRLASRGVSVSTDSQAETSAASRHF